VVKPAAKVRGALGFGEGRVRLARSFGCAERGCAVQRQRRQQLTLFRPLRTLTLTSTTPSQRTHQCHALTPDRLQAHHPQDQRHQGQGRPPLRLERQRRIRCCPEAVCAGESVSSDAAAKVRPRADQQRSVALPAKANAACKRERQTRAQR